VPQVSVFKDLYMRYAGLGDEPKRIKAERGNPARAWEKRMLNQGYQIEAGGKGWKFGYTYSVRR